MRPQGHFERADGASGRSLGRRPPPVVPDGTIGTLGWRTGRGPRLVGYHRLSDKDIGVTRKDPTAPGRYRPGYEEVLRLVDAHAVDVALCWDRFIHEPLDLEYLIPRFDKAGVRFAEADGNIDLGTDSGRLRLPY